MFNFSNWLTELSSRLIRIMMVRLVSRSSLTWSRILMLLISSPLTAETEKKGALKKDMHIKHD